MHITLEYLTVHILHVHVSATLVAILGEVSANDILQKLKNQWKCKIVYFEMCGLKCILKYNMPTKLCDKFK